MRSAAIRGGGELLEVRRRQRDRAQAGNTVPRRAVEVGASGDEQPELLRQRAVARLSGRVVIGMARLDGKLAVLDSRLEFVLVRLTTKE